MAICRERAVFFPEKRLSQIKTAAVLAASVVGAGYLYQRLSLRRDGRRFPAPGQLFACPGHPLHLVISGHGQPAVVLESGIAASSLSWSLVQPEIARFTRVCSYDRAGFGWSPSRKTPLSLRSMVADLRAALTAAAIPRPFVLAGHSFGGLIARAYAAWFPEEIAGLVLVDPVLPSEWTTMTDEARARLALGIALSRRGAVLARFGVVRFALALLASGARAIPQWISRLSAARGSSVVSRLVSEVRKLPPALWPIIQAHWSDPASFRTMARYLEALPASARIVASEPPPRGIPLTIISAGNAPPEQRREWDALTQLALPGKHIVATRSGHWIPFDQPDLVVDAIRAMVQQHPE